MDLAARFAENPLLRPEDVQPSRGDLEVECLLNPGAFRFEGRTGLLLRVAERPRQERGWVSTPVIDPEREGGIHILRIPEDDPELEWVDPRVFTWRGQGYLTTLSHLRLAWSDDGRHFEVEETPTLMGAGDHASFGLEDCRVSLLDGIHHLTCTAVSPFGVAVALFTTRDWRSFSDHGLILPPHNKDCALFEGRVDGDVWAFHRPSGVGLGGNYIWVARSPDGHHWGRHRCIATTRAKGWDSARLGAGAAPIRTDAGWLALIHAADAENRYCLGTLLLDAEDPTRLIGRSAHPVMEPTTDVERTGFFGEVIFTNGHVVDGDTLTVYYGAADTVVCGATFSIEALLGHTDRV